MSLALLLAVACEGARSSVLLLDEVDAALDEHNVSTVAALLSRLAHGTLQAAATAPQASEAAGGGGAGGGRRRPAASSVQILCVSHQPSFQKACDAVVQLSRQAGSTEVADAGCGPGAVKQGAAAVGGRGQEAGGREGGAAKAAPAAAPSKVVRGKRTAGAKGRG